MSHHLLAIVSLTGISLDVLGGLYLAYDLVPGSRGVSGWVLSIER